MQQVLTDLPGCLVLAVYPETAATFMQDLSNALAPTPPTGWSHTFFVVGTDGTYDPSLITDGLEDPSNPSGPSFVQGMYGTVALTNDHTRSEYNELANLYVAEVGLGPGKSDLDPYTSNQYDAVVLELLAMQAAGTTTDGPAIQQAMFDVSRGKVCGATPYGPANLGDALSALRAGGDINYQGASGDVDFDDYGDVIANFLVWQVKGSGFVSHAQISATELALALPKTDAGGRDASERLGRSARGRGARLGGRACLRERRRHRDRDVHGGLPDHGRGDRGAQDDPRRPGLRLPDGHDRRRRDRSLREPRRAEPHEQPHRGRRRHERGAHAVRPDGGHGEPARGVRELRVPRRGAELDGPGFSGRLRRADALQHEHGRDHPVDAREPDRFGPVDEVHVPLPGVPQRLGLLSPPLTGTASRARPTHPWTRTPRLRSAWRPTRRPAA